MTDRPPHTEMAEELAKLAWGKSVWLHDFADGRNKRPDHDIDRVRREMRVLSQAADDYRKASERNVA